MSKKNLTLALVIGSIFVIGLLIVGGVVAAKKLFGSSTPTPTEKTKKKISKPVNVIPFEERPFVVMAPTTSREVNVTVEKMPKSAESVEYLAEYQYGTTLGGNEQLIDLAKGLPATKQFALYSRSAGGKTSYEEDVMGGTLRLDFKGTDDYSLMQDWKYYDRVNPKSSTTDSDLTSKDQKFEVSQDSIKGVSYVIIYNSPGLPEKVEGTLASEVYTLGLSSSVSKPLSVTMETKTAGKGTIMGWDGKAWKSYETTYSGSKATAKVDDNEAYVLVE